MQLCNQSIQERLALALVFHIFAVTERALEPEMDAAHVDRYVLVFQFYWIMARIYWNFKCITW